MATYSDDVLHRIQKWEEFSAANASPVEEKPIQLTLPNGRVIDATAHKTTPMEICKSISNSLARDVIICKVNGKTWDLLRPLEESGTLEFFDFETDIGKNTFWHSSAHILGQAIEIVYPGCHLTIGPPLEDGGFYYDVALPNNASIVAEDLPKIQKVVNDIIKQKQNFSRLVLTKEQALEMFKGNKFKEEIISKRIPDGDITTAYRCGPLIDLCRGPHVLNTGKVAAMQVTRTSAAYWNADATKDALQRVYGISFPTKALLEEYKVLIAEAERRDHRKIGQQQQLFFFHNLSPGSAFFLPHGTRLYNRLVDFIRSEYRARGYNEVVSPNMYNVDLWKQSGHYQHYRDNMFSFEVEGQEFALKPMNCPGHCLLFNHKNRSYRDLPYRIADFGVLHRNEISGALSGLTRVRRFQQDDAHIFCRPDQIKQEIAGVLDFLQSVYGIFGFTFNLCLSTRPAKYIGDISLWDNAEAALKECLDEFCKGNNHTWTLNPGDGAFYGPKIDIQLTDALKRKHQCGTCQLDWNLPIRFGMSYRDQSQSTNEKTEKGDKSEKNDKPCEQKVEKVEQDAPSAVTAGEDGTTTAVVESGDDEEVPSYLQLPSGHERPVMIHRAILGSVERFIAVLTEHTAGKWPFWLNPRQAIVVPLSPDQWDYADKVRQRLWDAGFYADTANHGNQYKKNILDAVNDGYSYILIVGKQEEEKDTVNVRFTPTKRIEMSVSDCIAMFKRFTNEKVDTIPE